MKHPILAALILSLAACDSSSPAADAYVAADAPLAPDAPLADGGDSPDAHADGGPPLDCASPFTLPVAPDAEVRAQAALTALSPTASLTWNPARGTLSSISGLTIKLPGCTGSVNVYDLLFDVLEASPDLFQIERADWHPDFPVTCDHLEAETLRIRRVGYGPLLLRNDVFSARAERQASTEGEVVVLRFFAGTYIPPASPELLARLAGCPDLPAAELAAALRAQEFVYANFAPPPAPICSLLGPGEYLAAASDTLTVADDAEVIWEETDHDTTQLRRMRSATLRLAPANFTPELERSDANCPGEGGPDIGWIRFFDAITGAILGDHPNPVPGCIVC